MKTQRELPYVTISQKAAKSIAAGGTRVYDTEIVKTGESIENGSITDIFDGNEKYLGSGFYSEKSKIRVRLLSRNANDRFDEAFFERRVKYAWEYRKTVMPRDLDCCRVIFGEADGFPGLTVDKFADVLVTQCLCVGIERLRDVVYPLLIKVLGGDGCEISGIYERGDVSVRALEGLDAHKGWFPGLPHGDKTVIRITENGILYDVDIENGQKTGYFLDQKYNRLAVGKMSGGRTVLDCFTHTGSFAMNAVMGGAERVTAVDISEEALDMARHNASLNGMENKIAFERADVFELLPSLPRGSADFVILDPPAFTKSRKTVDSASRGYKEINLRSMKLLPRGGYLATASCSHFMENELFVKMLASAARDADVSLKQVEERRQSPDHPVLWNVPDTEYLKFYIFQLI